MDNKSLGGFKSSDNQRIFATGAVRDSAEGKPRMELLPLDLLERVARWYALGAEKYKDNNWRKGQPQSAVVGSLMRHLSKFMKGMTDEDHLAAIVWNGLSLMNADEYHKDNPAVCDINGWFVDNKPTGKGSYENEQYHENLKKSKESSSIQDDIIQTVILFPNNTEE